MICVNYTHIGFFTYTYCICIDSPSPAFDNIFKTNSDNILTINLNWEQIYLLSTS